MFFKDMHEAFHAAMEPVVPCRIMETRACVELSLTDKDHYRTQECQPRECTRFEKKIDVDAEIVRLKKEALNQ